MNQQITPDGYGDIHASIVALLEDARRAAARSVNALMTASYWEIGRRIVEAELENKAEPTGDGGMFSMPPRSRGTGRVPKGNLQGATNGVESLW